MFCRVEGIPDAVVRRTLHDKKTWTNHRDYFDHLDTLALGPNVASFVGHSAVRAHVMGLERSVTKSERMSNEERAKQKQIVEDALDAGYLGVSVQTLPWDKLGGSRDWRSRPLPSTYAPWSEVRELASLVRERDAIFQGVPNVSTKWNVILFLMESVGLFRRPLKTTVISMMDIVSAPGIHKVIGKVSRFFNRFLDADFKWQALPEVFDLFADGMDMVIFEEFGAGTEFLHRQTVESRRDLVADKSWRARFRRQWTSRFAPKAFHRQLKRAKVVAAPDASLVGKTFTQIAQERGADEIETFLDLVHQHGDKLRWHTIMANESEKSIGEIASHPDVLIGFSDAGAHLRIMAHYNFPLRLIRHAMRLGFMTPERAIQRCTSEIAEWLALDAGVLAVGRRADVVVLNPDAIDDRVEEIHEASVPELGDVSRLVRRNDDAVELVLINGRAAVEKGTPTSTLGREKLGRVLRRRVSDVADGLPPSERITSRAGACDPV
jgi:N-acyl-D-aspartate/D-glutamate deacylase